MAEYSAGRDRGQRRSTNGMSRRDFIKYSAVAGAVASVLPLQLTASHLASGTTPVAEAGAGGLNQDEFLENGAGKFGVDIPGLPMASANVQLVEVDRTIIDARETTTGLDVEWRTFAPGDAHWGKAKFCFRVGKDGRTSQELRQWVEDASAGKNVRKDISVVILNKRSEIGREYTLFECFPIKWDPGDYDPSSTTVCETLTVKMGRIEFKT